MLQRLGAAGLRAQLHFPAMRLHAEELRSLKVGALLCLPLLRGVSAEIRVGGVAVFRALPVRAGEHRAAQIEHALELISVEEHAA